METTELTGETTGHLITLIYPGVRCTDCGRPVTTGAYRCTGCSRKEAATFRNIKLKQARAAAR